MNRYYAPFFLLSAVFILTSCGEYHTLFPSKKHTLEDIALKIKPHKFYKVLLKSDTTAFIRVKRVEGMVLSGKVRLVNEKYYPIRDANGKIIHDPNGKVNLSEAKNVKKRRSMALMIGIPVAAGTAFVLWIGSLGPWTGD